MSPPQSMSTHTPIPLVRTLLSLFVLLHFGLLWIGYSSNWRRSGLYDRVLTLAQPYLIPLDLNLEMVPVEWGRAPDRDIPVRLILSKSSTQEQPIVLLDSQAQGPDRLMKRQLLGILFSVIETYDDESATELLSSIVAHADASEAENSDRIRLEVKRDPFSEYQEVYGAAIVREDGKPPRFIPTLEPQRTSKAMGGEVRNRSPLREAENGSDSE